MWAPLYAGILVYIIAFGGVGIHDEPMFAFLRPTVPSGGRVRVLHRFGSEKEKVIPVLSSWILRESDVDTSVP
jgi:hypothetical protein